MAQLGSSKVFGNLQVTGNIIAGTTITGTTLSISGTVTAATFSGTLSGNATTATTLQTARTINLVSFNGSQNITLTELYSIDDRTLAPADTNTRYMEFGFGSWNNNGVGPFADFLNMRSYSDNSGGNDNVLMLRKDAIGMRIYQQSFGSTTAYASYRDVAFTDSPTFTGQVVVAAGTSILPSIAQTGDSNTGIYFPADNTVAFTIDGQERMRFKSNGFIGISDPDPSYRLDVQSYASTPLRIQRSGEYGEVLKIGRAGVSDTAGINYPADGVFEITTASTPRMTISASGNIGIGATNPTSAKLVIKPDTNASGLDIIGATTSAQSFGLKVQAGTSSADYAMNIRNAALSANLLYVRGDGNVGVGTGSPIVRLDLGSGIGDKFNVYTGGANRIGLGVDMGSAFNGLSSYTNVGFNWGTWDGTTFTERMRLTGTGLGIGVTNPSYKLEVSGTGAFSGSSGIGAIRINGAGGSWFWLDNDSTTRMRFSSGSVAGTNPMYFTDGGSLGIGVAPTAKLEVSGGISLSGTLTFNGSTGSSGQVLTSQGSSAPVWSNAGTGTVTSVAATVPTIMTISGTPVTSSGTLAFGLATQNANLVFAGPNTGAAATPTFRSLVAADIPNLGASYLSLSGGTISGDLAVTGKISQGSTLSVTGLYASAFGASLYSGGTASFVEGISNAAMSEAAHAEGKFNLAVYGNEYTITARDNVNKAVVLSSTAGLTAGDTLHFYVINGAPVTGLTISSIAGSTVFLSGSPNITALWNMAVERAATTQYALHVEGHNNLANGLGAHAEGYQTKAVGDYGAHAEGYQAVASGDSSHAEGDSCAATDQGAHAEGYQTTASDFAAHAEGQDSTASGDTSHAQGYGTIAGGWVAHAEGDSTAALTDRSHAEGMNTLAAQGLLYTIIDLNDTGKTITVDNTTGLVVNNTLEIKRSGQRSPLVGVTISAINGNIITLNTVSSILFATHAIKKQNGDGGQHAEGYQTLAIGVASHSQNRETVASGNNSHSGGLGTIAQGLNQTVIGKYNVAQGTTASLVNTDHAFIIGNGTSGATRSNAVSIDWNGGATFTGTIAAATPTASNHVALKSNVDDAIAIAWLGL